MQIRFGASLSPRHRRPLSSKNGSRIKEQPVLDKDSRGAGHTLLIRFPGWF